MAIDRETIIKQIFNGTRDARHRLGLPGRRRLQGRRCGEFCKFDPAKAKALLDEAGGFKGGKITLSYNADAAHKEWTEATCNSIKKRSGCRLCRHRGRRLLHLPQQIHDRKMKGMFRTGWQMDYPSIENFLTPIYRPGASSNDGDYNNPAFDAKLAEAAAATDAGRVEPSSTRRPRRSSPRTWPPSRCGTARPPWAGPTRSPT